MNFKYIKRLLKCNRHGEVIQLMRDNIHTWSMDDYQKVYYLCCGFNSRIWNYTYKYFSEICVLYALCHIPKNICKHMRSEYLYNDFDNDICNKYDYDNLPYVTGSIRLLKYFKEDCINRDTVSIEINKYTNNCNYDILRYYIKTQKLNMYAKIKRLNGRVLNIYLLYTNDYSILVNPTLKIRCKMFLQQSLYDYCKYNEYAKYDKLRNLMFMLNPVCYNINTAKKYAYFDEKNPDNYHAKNPFYHNIILIDFIDKWKYMWNIIHSRHIIKVCKMFINKYLTVSDMDTLIYIVKKRDYYDYRFLYSVINNHFTKIKYEDKHVYCLKFTMFNALEEFK